MAAGDEDIRRFESMAEQAKAVATESRPLLQAIIQFPGLAWVKRWEPNEKKYYMVELSNQYVLRILGGKREDYIGKTDFDVWDYETAIHFYNNDEATRKGHRNATTLVEEPWESSRTGQKGTFVGYKWRFSVDGYDYIVGMGA